MNTRGATIRSPSFSYTQGAAFWLRSVGVLLCVLLFDSAV
jgi:hypothetical protein